MLALLVLGCGDRGARPGVRIAADGLPRAAPTPEERARFDAAAAWSEARGGLEWVVVRGDAVVHESRPAGRDPREPHALFSGTKTFACLLVQSARRAGELGSLDEPVGLAFPALLDPDDPRRAAITVRHLLSFTSGLDQDPAHLTRDGLREDQSVADKAAWAASRPLIHEPGTTFAYGSAHLWVFAGWYRARTGRDPLEALEERVLGPIGFAHADWTRDPAGNPAFAYGAATTAGQWAKVGMLLRDDGVWQGRRLLAPGAVAECATGSDVNPAYGLTLWLNRATDADLAPVGHTLAGPGAPILWPDGPADVFTAAGAFDQRLYVVPTQDLVIARIGAGSWRYRDADLLSRALADP